MTLHADSDLLKTIAAENRGQDCADPERGQAFGELAKRHAPSMYSLARHILGDHDLAEDAVQNALLGIWSRADTFDSNKGPARTWILRILVHQALHMRDKNARQIEIDSRWCLNPARVGTSEPGRPQKIADPSGDREALERLQESVATLPDRDRLLVALYYGADLTHAEIGRLLRMAKSTVAGRLRGILSQLQSDFKRTGLAGFGLHAELLREAISSGFLAPEGFMQAVLGRTHALQTLPGTAPREEARIPEVRNGKAQAPLGAPAGTRNRNPRSWAFALACGFSAAIILVLGAGAWTRPGTMAPALPVAPPAPVAPEIQAGPPQGLDLRWDFNTPESHRNIRLVEGSWHWVAKGGPDGSGCMEMDSRVIVAELSSAPALRPFKAEWKFALLRRPGPAGSPPSSDTYSAIGDTFQYQPGTQLRFSPEIRVREGQWLTRMVEETCAYGTGWINGRPKALSFYQQPKRLQCLRILVDGWHRIDDLVIRNVGESELADISACRRVLERIEPARRSGTLILRDAQIPGQDGPLEIRFPAPKNEAPSGAEGP